MMAEMLWASVDMEYFSNRHVLFLSTLLRFLAEMFDCEALMDPVHCCG